MNTLAKKSSISIISLTLFLNLSCSHAADNPNWLIRAANIKPTPAQLEHHKTEYIAFIHFGPNTFTGRKWGSGMEDPTIFQPDKLDTNQWCRAMKAAGMTKVIITVKHHDGASLGTDCTGGRKSLDLCRKKATAILFSGYNQRNPERTRTDPSWS